MSNKYANKPFLNAQMASLLQYSFTQSAYSNDVATATWAGATVTLSSTSDSTYSNIAIGSYLSLNGTSVGVLGISSGVLTVDLSGSGSYTTGQLTISSYTTTVQDALNAFLLNPFSSSSSPALYYKVIASCVSALNSLNTANPTTLSTGKNGIRLMVTGDDGLPVFDSGKASSGATSTNQITSLVSSSAPYLGNTYTNFSKKITIGSPNYSSSNTSTVSGITLIQGTAGGNGINENHNSRPEFLGALFSNTGIAYSKRTSSTTLSTNLYVAQRLGITSEDNLGSIRLNVPVTEA